MRGYHNTNHISGSELTHHDRKAVKLETRILEWLKSRPNQRYTPIEIWMQCAPDCLLQSVRRALSNLVDSEELKNTKATGEKKPEIYGTSNYMWYYELKVDNNGQIELI
jgi:hypothetical protein